MEKAVKGKAREKKRAFREGDPQAVRFPARVL